MKAVVLVGGVGTRLRPLTLDTPKQMLAVVETRMIERVLAHLAEHGVDEAVLSLGYRPQCFVDAFPKGVACGVRLSYAVDPEPLDTAGAIRFSALALGVTETFLVVNGDVLTDADLSALVARHAELGADATIALTPVEDPSAYGVVPTDAGTRVLAFIEKPPPHEAPTNLINAGLYVLEPSVLDRIPSGRAVSVERETFPALVAEGRLFAWASDAYWIDTGTPASYLRACADLLTGARPGLPAPGAWSLSPGVWATGSPKVAGGVMPHSLVADGAVVAAGAVVEDSVIGAGARVEAGARVSGSALLAGSVVGAGATVEGSIIGEGATVGEGASVSALSVLGNRAVVAPGSRAAAARIAAEPGATP
ncbi:MAG: sugar phosphate nucleotidyltransferase [Acidimicrobiales bacterium]